MSTEEPKPCRSTEVEPRRDLVILVPPPGRERAMHSGVLTHSCMYDEHDPYEVQCQCVCGRRWTRNYK